VKGQQGSKCTRLLFLSLGTKWGGLSKPRFVNFIPGNEAWYLTDRDPVVVVCWEEKIPLHTGFRMLFHQQIGLKFKEGNSKVPYLEYSCV